MVISAFLELIRAIGEKASLADSLWESQLPYNIGFAVKSICSSKMVMDFLW